MGYLTTGNSERTALALNHFPGEVLSDEDLDGNHWYDAFPPWPEPGDGGPRATTAEWEELCTQALVLASETYEKQVGGMGGNAMQRALGKEKTIGDKIAAITLHIQESPFHRLDELRTLLSYAQKKGRRERSPAIVALKDLFINDLLPDSRQLLFLKDREFSCGKEGITKRHLAYALFESELKTTYREFLAVLEESSGDTLLHFRQVAVKLIAELLVAKPEKEKQLLSMLVNKLGDPERKVSSTAAYKLSEMINKHHPQMRLIVVREVEQLINRPNVTRRTQYYAVCFLNQIHFTDGDEALSRKFVQIYMELFTGCLAADRKEEEDAKTVSKGKKVVKRKKGRRGKKVVAVKREGGVESKETRLMGAILVGVNRAYPYTNPEQDENDYQGYYESLYYVAHAKSFSSATQALTFLLQVSQNNYGRSDRFYRALYSRLYDAAEAGEPKQALFLNLVFKAFKADTNQNRLKAMMKRLLQAGISGSPGFAGACVMVVSETLKARRDEILKSLVAMAEYEDEEEHFIDVDKGQENGKKKIVVEPRIPKNSGSEKTSQSSAQRYNPQKRDPQHAGADRSSLWEMSSLCAHYHPSVAKFANSMCGNFTSVQYSGDPLRDFSLIAFLDRFSYKKPKNRIAKSLYGKRSSHYRDDPVANTEEFQRLVAEGNVQDDDKFLAKFFDTNPSRVVRELQDGEKPVGETGDDSEDEAYEQAIQAEMKRLGADGGFFSDAIRKEYGDVDGVNEDELKALHEAFGTDFANVADEKIEDEKEAQVEDSESESDSDSGADDVVPLATFEESDEDIEGGIAEEMNGSEQNGKKGGKRKRVQTSVFAAAEDYAEAIDEEAANATKAFAESEKEDVEAETVGSKVKRKQPHNGMPDGRKQKLRKKK